MRYSPRKSPTPDHQLTFPYSFSLYLVCQFFRTKDYLFELRAAGIHFVVCFWRWRKVNVYFARSRTHARTHTCTHTLSSTLQYLSVCSTALW